MVSSEIEWTDKVWNPVTGCTKVSQGCKHCYAERIAGRWWGDRPFSEVRTHPERLNQPAKLHTPSRIFVNSMSDLFHEAVPDTFIREVFAMMTLCTRHTFQVLTKRPERMYDFYMSDHLPRWPANIWLGVSIENQEVVKSRLEYLEIMDIDGVKFLSCEPLLGPLELELRAAGIGWVIVGGESGAGARPMMEEWARGIHAQCRQYQVPFFMKQMGGRQDKRGALAAIPEDLRVREFPGR